MAVNTLTAYLVARERCVLEVVNMVVAVEEKVNIKKLSYLIRVSLCRPEFPGLSRTIYVLLPDR
jgi:hypothetical protein